MDISVFRKSSLEKLSSPEQLDRLVRVTTPAGWIVLVGLLAVIAALLVWALIGNVPTTVEGNGIMMTSGGLPAIEHVASGMIKEILVSQGDFVRQGDIVARIDQLDIVNQINETKVRIAELESAKNRTRRYSAKDLKLQRDSLAQQEATISSAIAGDAEQLKFLADKLKAFEELEAKGGISKQQVVDAKNQYLSLQRAIAENQNRLEQIKISRLDLSKSEEQGEVANAGKIDEAERSLKLLEGQLSLKSKVTSPYTGRVIEVLANEGMVYQTGSPLIRIEPMGRDVKSLEAVLFVSSESGGNLRPGMEARISPSGVKKEEYGFMLGRVTETSDYPVSAQGMKAILGNETLVQSLVQKGPVFRLDVDLVPSSKTPSGKKWSTSSGPPFAIQSGTVCTAEIVEKWQHPIALVIPYIKKTLSQSHE
jgi:HlyD family secretion protein